MHCGSLRFIYVAFAWAIGSQHTEGNIWGATGMHGFGEDLQAGTDVCTLLELLAVGWIGAS